MVITGSTLQYRGQRGCYGVYVELTGRLPRTLHTLRKKVQLGTLFVPYLEPSGKRVPKRVLYMFKNLERFRI